MIFVVSTPEYFDSLGIVAASRVHSVDGGLCFIHKEELLGVAAGQYAADNGLFTEYTREELSELLQTPEWKPEEEQI